MYGSFTINSSFIQGNQRKIDGKIRGGIGENADRAQGRKGGQRGVESQGKDMVFRNTAGHHI